MKKKIILIISAILLVGIVAAGIGLLTAIDKDIVLSREDKADLDKFAVVQGYESMPEFNVSQLDCNENYCESICINIPRILNDVCKDNILPYWINKTTEEKIYYSNEELTEIVDGWVEEQLQRPILRQRINDAKESMYDGAEGKVAGGKRTVK